MSWSTGSEIFMEVAKILKEAVPDYGTRVEIYNELIPLFENYDCDTLYEVLEEDRAFDDVYFELHPEEPEASESEYYEEDLD